MDSPRVAMTCRPPHRYATFYAERGVTIDPALADRQHAGYASALRDAGLDVQVVAPDERFPDAVFIEDTAVISQRRALRAHMAVHREGEQDVVLGHLPPAYEIVPLPPAAALEGGDVLHTEDVTYVGRSSRTNASGISALREFLAPSKRRVVEVPVERCLHLKTAAAWLGDATMIVAHDLVDISYFEIERVLFTAEGEDAAANVLRLGSHLLVPAGYPATTRTFWEFAQYRKLVLHTLGMSEFEQGGGSLSCLSILM